MALFGTLSLSTSTAVLGAALALYVVVGAVYRLYLSPIAKFPGPKLAALTLWYEFYYDVWLGGQYIWKIRELHEEYVSLQWRSHLLFEERPHQLSRAQSFG
jgi:hypothetical protein